MHMCALYDTLSRDTRFAEQHLLPLCGADCSLTLLGIYLGLRSEA